MSLLYLWETDRRPIQADPPGKSWIWRRCSYGGEEDCHLRIFWAKRLNLGCWATVGWQSRNLGWQMHGWDRGEQPKIEHGWRKEIENGKPSNEALFHALNNKLKQVSETKCIFNRNKNMIGHLRGGSKQSQRNEVNNRHKIQIKKQS